MSKPEERETIEQKSKDQFKSMEKARKNSLKTPKSGDQEILISAFIGGIEKQDDTSMTENVRLLVPATYKEAMKSPQAGLWEPAIQQEYTSLTKNDTWVTTTLHKGRKALPSK